MFSKEEIQARKDQFHTPLLTEGTRERLHELGKDLDLFDIRKDQKIFTARVARLDPVVSSDELLEFIVRDIGVPIGGVLYSIKRQCCRNRRLHLAREQSEAFRKMSVEDVRVSGLVVV